MIKDKDIVLDLVTADMTRFAFMQLWELSTAAGAHWNYGDISSVHIIVTKRNAADVYGLCRQILEGTRIGIPRDAICKIRKARLEAHQYLYDEANDSETSIQRKIELVRLTSRH